MLQKKKNFKTLALLGINSKNPNFFFWCLVTYIQLDSRVVLIQNYFLLKKRNTLILTYLNFYFKTVFYFFVTKLYLVYILNLFNMIVNNRIDNLFFICVLLLILMIIQQVLYTDIFKSKFRSLIHIPVPVVHNTMF